MLWDVQQSVNTGISLALKAKSVHHQGLARSPRPTEAPVLNGSGFIVFHQWGLCSGPHRVGARLAQGLAQAISGMIQLQTGFGQRS